jgi:hypothetical protein
VEVRESTNEHSKNKDNKRNYNFKIFSHDAGGSQQDTEGLRETIKPHHAFLRELEHQLEEKGHLITLPSQDSSSIKTNELRSKLKSTFCVKVTGRALIEDYERIKSVIKALPNIEKFLVDIERSTIKESKEYKEAKNQISELQHSLASIKDREKKSKVKRQIKTLEDSIETALKDLQNQIGLEEWMLDGLSSWIDTFLSGIINVRVYPSLSRDDEHFFGHLKKEYFHDTDLESFHFTYGSKPTEELTLLGIVTSVPTEMEDGFRPLSEFENSISLNSAKFEHGFRQIFRGFDDLEQMIRTCRYTRVLVYPLLVYRQASPSL